MNTAAQTNFDEPIPELKTWNEGKPISVDVWLSNYGDYKLAIAFSQFFWPDFVLHEGCVLFAGFSQKSFDGFMKQAKGDRAAVEAVMNHHHLLDLFPLAEKTVTAEQMRYLGRMLQSMWGAKLKRDFPGRTFEVSFQDEDLKPDDWLEYQVTFWQPSNRPTGK